MTLTSIVAPKSAMQASSDQHSSLLAGCSHLLPGICPCPDFRVACIRGSLNLETHCAQEIAHFPGDSLV